MFNPNPHIQLQDVGGRLPCVVIDNALQDPESMVEFAARNCNAFVRSPAGTFPGMELRMSDGFSAHLHDFFLLHARRHFAARRTLSYFSRLSMVAREPRELTPLQRVCHRDVLTPDPNQSMFACVLYLFHDPFLGGTSFFRPRKSEKEIDYLLSRWAGLSDAECTRALNAAPAYPTTTNEFFELVCTVPAAWNRIIFYDSLIFHTGDITQPHRLVPDPIAGRLTLNGFFVCRPAAATTEHRQTVRSPG